MQLLFPLFDEASDVDKRLRAIKVLVSFETSQTVAGLTLSEMLFACHKNYQTNIRILLMAY